MNKRKLSLDWWSVIAALAAVALIKAGVLPAIPW
jgi:hypothetical protein